MILVFVVIHSREDAVRIGGLLLDRRIIAGYNLLSVESSFWWKGNILREPEALLLLKTTSQNFPAVEDFVKTMTGAEVPEIFALTPAQAGEAYAAWVSGEASGSANSD